MRSKVMLLYGTSERVISDGICSIGVFHRHVTLTFVEGVDLQDPGQLLRGAGKTMRHLRVASSADLDRKEVPQVPARQARTLAGLSPRQRDTEQGVVTRVKRRSGPAYTSVIN